MDGKVPATTGPRLKAAGGKVVKAEQAAVDSNSGINNADLAARTGEAGKAAKAAERENSSGGDQRGATDEDVYADPAVLKWRIFEAVANTNGQRAFATYWSALRDFMRGRLPRSGLDDALESSLGPDHLHLHDELIMCLLNNARCRYLPADLVSQVPASIRGKVVVVQADVEPPLPKPTPSPAAAVARSTNNAPSATAPALSGGNAVPSPFQGKRTEGLLQNAGEFAAASGGRIDVGNGSTSAGNGVAAGGSLGRARENTKVGASPEFTTTSGSTASSLKVEGGSNGSGGQSTPRSAAIKLETAGVTAVVTPPEGGPWPSSSSPGGGGRRYDDRIRPARTSGAQAEQNGSLSSESEKEELWREAQLLEDEIASHFGSGSDLWQPWCGGAAEAERYGPVLQQQQQQQDKGLGSRKRPAGSGEGGVSDGACHESERSPKALKREEGAAAPAVDSAANGVSSIPGPGVRQQASGQAAAAAAAAAANDLSPPHQPQRVPAARTLAPFLQALTASQQLKVSHEVCRVMTAGVKEYLRGVIEACLLRAREEQRRGAGVAAAASRMQTKAAAAAATASAGTGMTGSVVRSPSVGGASPPSAAAATASRVGGGQCSGGGGGGVLTPGHLQSALETMPRLVGPPSSARAQWRRVATYAADHQHQGQRHHPCQ